MENILVVLAIIGSVVYKIYTSYKEEVEKAAKRRQPVPPIPQPTQTRQHVPAPKPPIPVTTAPPIPKRQPQKKAPQPVTVQYDKSIPDEVKRVQQQKLAKQHRSFKTLEEHDTPVQPFEFDLRQAVIQSAILERPYQ